MKCGTHISKCNMFITSLKQFYDLEENKGKPCQIFSCSPTVWKRTNILEKDKADTKEYIKQNNLNVFVHSFYLGNLCKLHDEFLQCFECLKWEFQNGKELGFKGIVIHCGKSLKLSKEKAIDNMYNNILSLLDYIDESCPFILETSAGQGTEVLSKYEDFSNFYNRFNEQQKKKIKICIDTCHVFAAGHDPLEFIQNWITTHNNSLILIHFNDSKHECGCRKDRHAYPGMGYIGLEKMKEIYHLCNDINVPLIIE